VRTYYLTRDTSLEQNTTLQMLKEQYFFIKTELDALQQHLEILGQNSSYAHQHRDIDLIAGIQLRYGQLLEALEVAANSICFKN
jgi:hypothetical protein